MSSAPGEYEFVMPFVVCASRGGDLEDRALVVGYELGSIDAEMQALAALGNEVNRPLPIPRYVHTVGVPQLDLIAMRHGYVLTTEAWTGDGEWSRADFTILGEEEES